MVLLAGNGTFKSWGLVESLQVTWGMTKRPLLSLFHFPHAMRWVSCFTTCFCHDTLPCHRPRSDRPINSGLKPLTVSHKPFFFYVDYLRKANRCSLSIHPLKDRLVASSLGWSWIHIKLFLMGSHYVVQVGLKLLASASQMLGLLVCATTLLWTVFERSTLIFYEKNISAQFVEHRWL